MNVNYSLTCAKWTLNLFKIEMVNYERKLLIFNLWELNFELVHENLVHSILD